MLTTVGAALWADGRWTDRRLKRKVASMDSASCAHVDMALSLQQTIRSRIAPGDAGQVIGEACGEPSVGFVDDLDGLRRHFCVLHPLEPRIVRN